MDQVKIGKFIAACRKEAGLTQASLAEKLGITDRAVSKWETGKSLPDASIMLELCGLLEIDVNELLTGEHITMENYKNKAEANLLEMSAKVEQKDKLLLKVEKIMIAVAIPFYAAMIIIGAYVCKGGNIPLGIALIVMAVALVAVLRYVPTMKAVVMAPHMGTSRKMVCPYCGKKGYHKKVISKNKGEN